ncbi:hypothetical protein PROFUN_06328 [Planoprotostelium fungivorum]|uniref:Tubulin epsilon and delta complex protein 1 domain-containing protein n=1 Tax=Planoprotostelium fungivorum TaxID=1890364 RepID=A0A2P6NP51_9EUKA|nr:hypothetical protein PROFUN_06328 [Planoprotostelium fungivorum]
MTEHDRGIRPTIEFLCEALRKTEIDSSITLDFFRKSRTNDPMITKFATLDISAARPKSSKPSAMASLWRNFNEDQRSEAISFIQHHLQEWGYDRNEFYEMDIEEGHSRELLLAFGWLLAHSNFFRSYRDRYLATREDKARQMDIVGVPLPPYPQHTCFLPEFNDEEDGDDVRMNESLSAVENMNPPEKKLRAMLNQLIMITGSVDTTVRSIEQWQVNYEKLIFELYSKQEADGQRDMFSPYQLWLLSHPELLAKHQLALEHHNTTQSELQRLAGYQTSFFHWMESVANEMNIPTLPIDLDEKVIADDEDGGDSDDGDDGVSDSHEHKESELRQLIEGVQRNLMRELTKREKSIATVDNLWNGISKRATSNTWVDVHRLRALQKEHIEESSETFREIDERVRGMFPSREEVLSSLRPEQNTKRHRRKPRQKEETDRSKMTTDLPMRRLKLEELKTKKELPSYESIHSIYSSGKTGRAREKRSDKPEVIETTDAHKESHRLSIISHDLDQLISTKEKEMKHRMSTSINSLPSYRIYHRTAVQQ